MHAIKDRPVVVNGQIVIRPIMVVALTYDHRLLDGREAVTFLGTSFASAERKVADICCFLSCSQGQGVPRGPEEDAPRCIDVVYKHVRHESYRLDCCLNEQACCAPWTPPRTRRAASADVHLYRAAVARLTDAIFSSNPTLIASDVRYWRCSSVRCSMRPLMSCT